MNFTTLTNKTRPDCVVFMPDSGPLVIDAKFPLEAMTALRDAATDEERKFAIRLRLQDITQACRSTSPTNYLIPGETQDIAPMFIPSESVYADLHEQFDELVQKAQRARVMIVSPTLMVSGDPGHQAGAQGCRNARGRRPDPAPKSA